MQILKQRRPDLIVEGEMQADTAVVPEIAQQDYPWSAIQGDANVLVFPNLDAANAAYKLLWRLGGAEVIGPILQGIAKPVHVLQRGVDVNDIVNMAAIAVLDAQELESRCRAGSACRSVTDLQPARGDAGAHQRRARRCRTASAGTRRCRCCTAMRHFRVAVRADDDDRDRHAARRRRRARAARPSPESSGIIRSSTTTSGC